MGNLEEGMQESLGEPIRGSKQELSPGQERAGERGRRGGGPNLCCSYTFAKKVSSRDPLGVCLLTWLAQRDPVAALVDVTASPESSEPEQRRPHETTRGQVLAEP